MMVERQCLILGAGGHARVVADLLLSQNWQITGFLGPDMSLWGTNWRGIPVLGGDEKLTHYPAHTHALINGVGSTGYPVLRRALFERYIQAGYSFPHLVHVRASIANDVIVGEGSQIMAGAIVQTNTVIGKDVIINTGACVDHDCCIEDHVHIAPGAVICAGVKVGPMTHIGAGAVLLQGIRIGTGCIVGAGAVVTTGVMDSTMVMGVPAKEV